MSTPRNELPVLQGMKGSLLREPPKNREDEIRLLLMGFAALFSYLGLWRSFSPIDFVAIGATLVGGYPVFVETFHSLRHRSINMEVSMTEREGRRSSNWKGRYREGPWYDGTERRSRLL